MSNPALTVDNDDRPEVWDCNQCMNVCLFSGEPDIDCWNCGADDWEPAVLAARRPREGNWGIVECSNCGHTFVERNSDGVTGWVCNDCGRNITCHTQRPEIAAEPNETIETEQTALPTGTADSERTQSTDGGRNE